MFKNSFISVSWLSQSHSIFNMQDHQFQTQLLLRRNTLVGLVLIRLNVKIIFPRKYFVSQLLFFISISLNFRMLSLVQRVNIITLEYQRLPLDLKKQKNF